jgi:hypothetical protein
MHRLAEVATAPGIFCFCFNFYRQWSFSYHVIYVLVYVKVDYKVTLCWDDNVGNRQGSVDILNCKIFGLIE